MDDFPYYMYYIFFLIFCIFLASTTKNCIFGSFRALSSIIRNADKLFQKESYMISFCRKIEKFIFLILVFIARNYLLLVSSRGKVQLLLQLFKYREIAGHICFMDLL
jgi:hypothetical protein